MGLCVRTASTTVSRLLFLFSFTFNYGRRAERIRATNSARAASNSSSQRTVATGFRPKRAGLFYT